MIRKLKNWKEITKGLYRYVIAASLCYDAIEDINDLDTDMPVVMFNSSKNLGKPISTQSGKEALEDIYKKYRNK